MAIVTHTFDNKPFLTPDTRVAGWAAIFSRSVGHPVSPALVQAVFDEVKDHPGVAGRRQAMKRQMEIMLGLHGELEQ